MPDTDTVSIPDTIPLAYYNEIDPYCCQWLQNLIDNGILYPGFVDGRSIADIDPHEISRYRQVHLFAGLGGWAYALQLAGWPEHIPVWTGSCPCQPFSAAGKRKGTADARHLWPEMRRLITECRPAIAFGEQVASKDGRIWLSGVRSDLEELGYGVGAADLCAAGIGAPHIRQRLYWVADTGRLSSTGWREFGIMDGTQGTTKGEAHQREWVRNAIDDGSGFGWVADRSSTGLAGWPQQPAWEECAAIERGCAVGGLAITGPQRTGRGLCGPGEGPCTVAERASDQSGGSGGIGSNPWSPYSLIPCLDGKSRRIEPSTFPLANGVPARVGRLRAYGNAIVPQVAAEFITAYMEAVGILPY